MDNLAFARAQMGLSLAFHIVFAVMGVGMPLLMIISEAAWLRTGERTYLDLTRRWARGTAILFAVGAVSGTVLSFYLVIPDLTLDNPKTARGTLGMLTWTLGAGAVLLFPSFGYLYWVFKRRAPARTTPG
jgi:cytochrome bd-type quinol oxidase subunit 2